MIHRLLQCLVALLIAPSVAPEKQWPKYGGLSQVAPKRPRVTSESRQNQTLRRCKEAESSGFSACDLEVTRCNILQYSENSVMLQNVL